MALFDWLFRRNAVPEPAQRTTKTQVNEALVHDSPTAGYRPPLPAHLFYSWGNGSPSLFQFYYDWWSQMHLHPRVQLAMRTYKSGISGAEICVTSRNLTAQNFAQEQFDRLWQKSLATLQEAYDVGWGGFEVVYRFDDDGRLAFDKLKSFRSQDTKPLFRLEKFYGIRVSNVLGKKHPVDLWAADGVGLAKGFWYAHHATQGRIFGWPQGYGAWKPWRRLGFENGSEDTIDLAVFRFGVQGPTVWFPPGKKNIAEDKRDARDPSNRDLARDFADNAKSGVSTALPSEFDPATGKELWRIEWPKHVIDVDSLINYNGSLEDQIDMGIGVPPEMNDQGEGGGLGYRGREIPLEAFYDGQTTLAQSIVQQFADQVVLPLTRWNCGEDVTFDVSVKPIMETRRNRDGGAPGQPGQPVQGQPSPPTPPNDKPGSPIRLSTLTDNPVQVALGDPEAEAIVSVLLRRLASTNRQLVRSIVTALTVHTIFDRWQKVQQLLDEHREVVAKTLADAGLASSLAAMRWVGDRIPTRSTNRFEMVPPSAPPPRFTSADFEDGKPYVRLTMIDESANNLAQRGILTREEFDQLSYEARQTAFTVAGVPSTETLETLRNSLADAVTQGWSQRTWEKNVAEALKVDPFISPAHQETVFRTNVQTAYSKGLDKVLDHPLVGTYFPYEAIDPILDDRCRPHHRALATSGINGTNVYRRDDPTYAIVKPPSGYNCRCGRRPLTIEQAAAAGVEEAAKWQETGKEPTIKAWVSLPANWKDDGFVRMATAHAPVGGITIAGKFFPGGEFIPNETLAQASPSEFIAVTDGMITNANTTKSRIDKAYKVNPDKHPGDDKKTAEHHTVKADEYTRLGTRSQSFKSWFGDWENDPNNASKIVNAKGEPQESNLVDGKGEPIILYHGTPSGEFGEFQLHKAGTTTDSGWLGKGFYFTDDPKLAHAYSKHGAAQNPAVMPVYLNIKKPFIWGKKTRGVRDLVNLGKQLPAEIHDAVINRTGFTFNPDVDPDFSMERVLSDAITKELMARGYDGVVAEYDSPHGGREFLAFDPSQIKSVANIGTFDPNDNRIHFSTLDNIRAAAIEVDPNPSEDQKAAGNYRKGHLTWNGLPITIETAKGQTRSGTGDGGKQWSIDLEDHYGYIKRTESEADGDHIDVFLCEDHPDSEIVFVVNQMRPDGSFDEHKVILGQCCKSDAKAAYLRNYSAGWTGCGSIVPMTLAEFKQWIENGDTAKAV